MISAWELYLWTRLDQVSLMSRSLAITIMLGVVCFYIFALARMAYGSDWDDFSEGSSYQVKLKAAMNHGIAMLSYKLPRFALCAALFMFCFAAAIPSKKDAAMIWIVPQLATVENAELLKGEAAEIYTLAKETLKESIGAKETE